MYTYTHATMLKLYSCAVGFVIHVIIHSTLSLSVQWEDPNVKVTIDSHYIVLFYLFKEFSVIKSPAGFFIASASAPCGFILQRSWLSSFPNYELNSSLVELCWFSRITPEMNVALGILTVTRAVLLIQNGTLLS